MKQYLKLLQAIQENGTDKPAARANMPGTRSLFGYQFRHDLADGFPLLTTKKMFWKGVVVELLWFLRGDTNIKYLVDNGCNIWNEDAYQYFQKVHQKAYSVKPGLPFDAFVEQVKKGIDTFSDNPDMLGYRWGDCGEQYGKLWRSWKGDPFLEGDTSQENGHPYIMRESIDQIAELIKGLKNSPESRRHILTAWNPATLDQMALNACHVLVQFNCRPLTYDERFNIFFAGGNTYNHPHYSDDTVDNIEGIRMGDDSIKFFNNLMNESNINVPRYKLDCQLYQRSADSILGVPFNIASYALLTMMLAQMVNMVPGDFIHSFGDAHVYDNHKEAVAEQLTRTPTRLPILLINENVDWVKLGETLDFESLYHTDFVIGDYHPQPSIKAELKTGL